MAAMTVAEKIAEKLDNEINDIQSRIAELIETARNLNKELSGEYSKLHALKEKRFEVSHNIKKGDIIQDIEGVKYYYHGISQDWYGNPLLVSKITKSGKPSKNTMHVARSKFNSETIKVWKKQ